MTWGHQPLKENDIIVSGKSFSIMFLDQTESFGSET